MRVVHVIKAVGIAGAERHLLALLSGLREAEIDAQLLLLVKPGNPMDDFVRLLVSQDVPVERLAIRHHLDASLIFRLRTAFHSLRPDIAHTHLIHADVYGIPAARLAGVPLIVTGRHNDDAFRRRLPIRWLNRILWQWVDAGTAISDSIARFSIDVEGAAPDKVHRIHYGLDTATQPLERAPARAALIDELGMSGDPELVGMVCRLVEQKGVSYGLQAFAGVAAQFPTAHLLIAGEGPLRPTLERQAASAGLSDRIRFLGWRDHIPQLMAALDVLMVPSLWEGFGLVILEAMAQQLPVIGSDISAIPEIIRHGETGLLVPPRDPVSLAEALRQLLADKPLRHHMGLLGRDYLETEFSAGRMVERTTALYHTLMDGL